MRNPNGPSIEEKEAMAEHLQDMNERWLNDHSPLPWTLSNFTKPDGSEIKTSQDVADTVAFSTLQCEGTELWGVTLDEKDAEGRVLVICYTGNGPHSEANARLIVAAVNALNITQPYKSIPAVLTTYHGGSTGEGRDPLDSISGDAL